MGTVRVLLVEDNQRLARSLAAFLTDDGYAIDIVHDGVSGQEFAETLPYDAIVLDVLLPGQDGFLLCRTLRDQRINAPILLLTALDSVEDRIRGLDCGADDYLIKPFEPLELTARLRALLRRQAPQKTGLLEAADLRADPATREVFRGGQRIELTAREFAVLEALLRRHGQIVSREQMEQHVWNVDYEGGSNVVDVYMRRLRRKIDDPFDQKLIQTVRGAGYRLLAAESAVGVA